jgi:Spy/CpxP family protein refolding chaperone
MNPRMRYWWEYVRHHDAGRWAGWGAFVGAHGCHRMYASGGSPGDYGRATFGVRRPLRLLAYKLGLEAEQVRELVRILDRLKTERAQAEVDERRAVAAFADALAGATFEEEKAREGATLRVKSVERLKEVVVQVLGQLHALLTAEQRAKLAYLIRTGVITL